MLILISNDDGVDAAGLEPLARALQALGEPWVVAPERERSAASHALTLHKPLRCVERAPPADLGGRWFHVSGSPADCVYVALHHLLPERPALVVSGINRGPNLGDDVTYSGTVAAAREGHMNGVPALAVSLVVDSSRSERHWGAAAVLAARVARELLAHPSSDPLLLNMNVPDRPLEEIRGIRACDLSRRRYRAEVAVRRDPRGREYYWIGGPHERFEGGALRDGPLIEAGWASLSPLRLAPGAPERIPEIAGWESLDS